MASDPDSSYATSLQLLETAHQLHEGVNITAELALQAHTRQTEIYRRQEQMEMRRIAEQRQAELDHMQRILDAPPPPPSIPPAPPTPPTRKSTASPALPPKVLPPPQSQTPTISQAAVRITLANLSPNKPSAPQQISEAPKARSSTLPSNKHDEYLAIHNRLKDLRRNVFKSYKDDQNLKASLHALYHDLKLHTIGELKREMNKRVSQLTIEAAANRSSILAAKEILSRAYKLTNGLLVDPMAYTIAATPSHTNSTGRKTSALFLYLLSIFAKAIVNKLISEAGASTASAEPVGIAAITMFAQFRDDAVQYIDVLLAKYHRVCPVLFGINGNEKTEAGRALLGWQRHDDGTWVPEQEHFDKITALGAGFGSLSLRDFSKAKFANPFPAHNYWQAMARILNTTAPQITRTQCVVVKAMLEMHVERLMSCYGGPAKALLKAAVVSFPARAPSSTEATSLGALREEIRTRNYMTL